MTSHPTQTPAGCGRRRFLARLFAFGVGTPLLAAAVVGQSARRRSAPVQGAAPPTKRAILLNKVCVAGLPYSGGLALLDAGLLPPGEPVCLVAEPDNPHDVFAVRLEARGRKIGYVPRAENHHLSRCLRAGESLSARVLEVRPGEPVHRRVRVEISLVC